MYPLQALEQSHRLWVSLALFAISGVIGLWMQCIAGPMRAAGGPGIVPFELTEDAREARRILTRWGATGRAAAKKQTYVDFAFLVGYGLALSAFAAYIGGRASKGHLDELHVAAVVFAWIALVAALCDAIEDVAMLITIGGFKAPDYLAPSGEQDAETGERQVPSAASVQVSRYASRAKFGLIAVSVLFLPIGLAVLNLA